jgi:multicomponent Na+:H+ antiporter subunit C
VGGVGVAGTSGAVAAFWRHYPYFFAVVLFLIGAYTLLVHPNLLKKIIGLNIASTAVFLFFIAMGNVRGRMEPLIDPAHPAAEFVNPVPSALILTGIVVSVSITAFALALVLKLYRHFGMLNAEEIVRLRGRGEDGGR